ncbi:MAG TPA: hypothetical protein VN827_07495 [Chthoniobacterales bacterium]|nr:hypothetical protein [Chthoniobacterales bacterium]
MKLSIAFSVVAVSIGIISQGFADQGPVSGGPADTASTGIGTTSATAKANAPTPESTPDESKTDESDDTLYRGKTTESENPMIRDEGTLHFKTRPKEKIKEVDSLKHLQSSGSDPKFQSNLLDSGVSSIEKVGARTDEASDEKDEGDPRFKTKRLTFTPDKNDESKQAQSDSSPSPTPSPTPSPAAKNSSKE